MMAASIVSPTPHPVPGHVLFLVRAVSGLLLLMSVGIAGCTWCVPIESFEAWGIAQAGQDPFQRLEWSGRAELGCWLARFIFPLVSLLCLFCWRNPRQTAMFFCDVWRGGWAVCNPLSSIGNWRAWCLRGLIIGWIWIAIANIGHVGYDLLGSWVYYRFRSDSDVLPNISDSNRAVIWYLREATPPDARIFIASDQRLYFLSYYLLPRRLYYQVHPATEYVVAQPNQQRRLEAYSLSAIEPQTLQRIDPDYTLEYFEHPDAVDHRRLKVDAAWIAFYRRLRRDPAAVPPYLVSLRKVQREVVP